MSQQNRNSNVRDVMQMTGATTNKGNLRMTPGKGGLKKRMFLKKNDCSDGSDGTDDKVYKGRVQVLSPKLKWQK